MKMKIFKSAARALTLMLTVLLASNSLPAQQRRPRTRRTPRRSTVAIPARRTTPTTPAPTTTPPPAPAQTGVPATVRPASPPATAHGAMARATAEENISFDTLLTADHYMLYGELRGIGQQISSGEVLKLLEPLWKLTGTPKEVGAMVEFLRAHDEQLNDARLMFATLAANPSLPQALLALELPSVEAAQKFAPELHSFLTSVAPSEVEIKTEGVEVRHATRAPARTRTRRQRARRANYDEETARGARRLPFFIKRTGNLILASDAEFNPKNLKSNAARPLSGEPHFKTARGRFATESAFLYFDYAAMQRNDQRRREELQARQNDPPAVTAETTQEQTRTETENNPVAPTEDAATQDADEVTLVAPVPVEAPTPSETTSDEMTSEGVASGREPTPEEVARLQAGEPMPGEGASASPGSELALILPRLLGGAMFGGGGEMKMPEAISLGAGLEGESFVLRLLLLNSSNDAKTNVIPLIPILVNGPAQASDAASIAPADTDIYVSASLDLAQMYDQFIASIKQNHEREMDAQAAEARRAKVSVNRDDTGARVPVETETEQPPQPSAQNQEPPALVQLAALEKLLGFRIREDLIGALGNEVAVGIPEAYINGTGKNTPTPPATTTDKTSASDKPATEKLPPPNPVILVSLRNKDALQSLLPRLFRMMGLVRQNATEPKVKSGDVEVMTYGDISLAFIGNYLAIAPDAATVRRVAARHADGQTLAAAEGFRQAMSWQPKQTLGQVYVSSAFLKSTFASEMRTVEQSADDESKNFLAQFKLEPGAITHAVVNEGDGPLHEVRIARNVIEMFVAYTTISDKLAPVISTESRAMGALNMMYSAQMNFRETSGKGRFGTLQELKAANLVTEQTFQMDEYRLELNASGDKFEASATPAMYPERGRRSFFVNETGVIRGGDKGGQRASVSDEPVN